MTLVLVVLVLAVVVNCGFVVYLIADVTTHSARAEREPGNVFWLGLISFFQFLLSTFGISDFALGAAVYSKLKWVSARQLPGTVNTAAVIPVAVMALVYITSIQVDLLTLLVPIAAQMAGAYISPRFVVKMPVRPIRIFLAIGMLVTVLRVAAEGFGFFPAAGDVTALDADQLLVLGCLCLLYGALNNLGIGSYAPTMATVCIFGLNPEAAFPIMVGAATFSVPIASIQFVRHGSYSRKITVISAVCGTLGVLAAAFTLKNTDISPLKWIVAGFLLYSACSMFLAALKNREDAVAAPKPAVTENRLSIVGRLTGFCLALILLCTVSLIVIFVSNFHILSSGYVEVSIDEHNARLRDSVHAYLRAHESMLLSARSGVARFMSKKPVDLEQLRLYLEHSSHILEDISTMYCTTNEVWNHKGGYAVFSQPWDIPPDWNNTERPWFKAAKNAPGKIAYSKPYLGVLTGDIILDMSITVHDESGKDIGVVSASITIAALDAMLHKSATLEGQRVFLIDADGVFVVHPDKTMVAQGNFFKETGLEGYRNDILSAGHFSATDKGVALYSSSIPAAGWFVVSMIPTENISSSINARLLSLFLTPMLIIFFMLLVVLISLLIIIRGESRAKNTAERITREKDYFIARVSHEIRTPMNAIIGMSELARREHGKPESLEYIEGIRRAGDSLLGIINDILDCSKIESGQLAINAATYDTASLLNDVLAIIRIRVAEKALTLMADISPALPSAMTGDAGRIRQILLNLLNNAVKYTDTGFIKLSVFGEQTGENAIRLTLTVEDSGIGIRQEELQTIFADFARLDEKRNSAIEGTGLGLPITRSLCRTMGGDLVAASAYGKGSVFTATLTQRVDDWRPMDDLASPTHYAESPKATFTAPEAALLLVDDLPNNLIVAEGLLRPYRMRVHTCRNGREAFDLVQAHSFDLVLMDHMMPDMDGIEATAIIRALGGRFATLPIVALTANAMVGMREYFLERGFSDYISKPVDPGALDAVLVRWIPEEKRGAAEAAQEAGPEPGMAGAAKGALAAHQLDRLNHYHWHFAAGLPADQAYYTTFVALVEGMDVAPQLRDPMASLAAAGRRGDVEEIRRLLPGVCEALAAAGERVAEQAQDARATSKFEDALVRLKTALENGDSASADTVMGLLRGMDSLREEERELYFCLYDALLMGETAQAAAHLEAYENSIRPGRRRVS